MDAGRINPLADVIGELREEIDKVRTSQTLHNIKGGGAYQYMIGKTQHEISDMVDAELDILEKESNGNFIRSATWSEKIKNRLEEEWRKDGGLTVDLMHFFLYALHGENHGQDSEEYKVIMEETSFNPVIHKRLEELEGMFEEYQYDNHYVTLGVLFHYWYLQRTVPSNPYNRSVARLIMNFILIRNQYAPYIVKPTAVKYFNREVDQDIMFEYKKNILMEMVMNHNFKYLCDELEDVNELVRPDTSPIVGKRVPTISTDIDLED